MLRSSVVLLALTLLYGVTASNAQAQAITYQGRLDENGSPVSAECDFQFRVYDATTGGAQVGVQAAVNNVMVTEGLFTVIINVGAVFTSADRWLEIDVRRPAGSGPFTTLTPRQVVTATPYAIGLRTPVTQTSSLIGVGLLNLTNTTGPGLVATGGSQSGTGVSGFAGSPGGSGVFGRATSTTGANHGGWFQSFSSGGVGVRGQAIAATGETIGVVGESNSSSGTGVFGLASASAGFTYGVHGKATSQFGWALFGEATSTVGTTYGLYASNASAGGAGVFGFATATTGSAVGVWGKTDSPQGFNFLASGAGTDYGSISSRRWKSEIHEITDPLEKLTQIRGVYFNWDKDHGGHHDVGMIAEEVGEVLPEVVNYEANGVDAIGMDYSKLTPLLVEAVKALRVENDALHAETDAEIAALQQQVNDLKAMVELLLAERTIVAGSAADEAHR